MFTAAGALPVFLMYAVVVYPPYALFMTAGSDADGNGRNSYAPTSHAGPIGRGLPRWSVYGGGQSGLPLSRAGLPVPIACVSVGPPLFCSGPSCGSVFD